MSKSKKRRSGKKNLGLTRNQRRKQEYAAARLSSTPKSHRPKKRGRGTGMHEVPCGNPACNRCYERILRVGIFRRRTVVLS